MTDAPKAKLRNAPFGVTVPHAVGSPTLYRSYTVEEFEWLPEIEWLVDGLLSKLALAVIFGPSQAGKSALQLDISFAVAYGLPWAGRATTQGKVLYIALEGQSGLRPRAKAMAERTGQPVDDQISFVFEPFSLLDEADIAGIVRLAAQLGGVALIVVDTLAFAMAGGDENSSRDMSTVVANAKALQAQTGASVMLVHHTGKNAERGMRGHTILPAAVDTTIEVKRGATQRSWTAVKVRDGEDGVSGGFNLEVVELEPDSRGRPVHTVIVQHVNLQADADAAPPKLGKHQQVALEVITRELSAAAEAAANDGDALPSGIGINHAVELIKGELDVDPKRRGERASAAIKGLLAADLLVETDSVLYLPEGLDV